MDGEGGIVVVLGNGRELDCVWVEVVLTGARWWLFWLFGEWWLLYTLNFNF
jgi:hypothetical protein